MKFSSFVLLFVATIGCGSGTQTARPAAESAAVSLSKAVAAQRKLGDPMTNSIGMVLAPIPAGQFQMGSPNWEGEGTLQLATTFVPVQADEKPQHLVNITKPFYLSVYEVTQAQYEKVMGERPWQDVVFGLKGPDYPATWVCWEDAVEFCRRLSEMEGINYRLPTEAQWEYACRAGRKTVFGFGDDESKLGEYAWYRSNSWELGERYAHQVGQKLPNAWGLYDMHGNVREWCQDWYAQYDDGKVLHDPLGPALGEQRIVRGGCILNSDDYCRSAIRDASGEHPSEWVGFRISRTYP